MFEVSVNNQVLLVTGANREKGIGRALVVEAVKRGAKKVYATARQVDQLNDLVNDYPGKVVALELDVTNARHIQRLAQEASDTDILINNAGFAGGSGCVNHFDEQVARHEFEVNFYAPIKLMNAFVQSFLARQHGVLVNILSIGSLVPFIKASTYCASKAALYSMTRTARIELMEHKIPVFGVYPGPIDTEMAATLTVQKETSEYVAVRVYQIGM